MLIGGRIGSNIQLTGSNIHSSAADVSKFFRTRHSTSNTGVCNIDVVPLPHVFIGAQEHDHCFLTACALGGAEVDAGAGFCAVDKGVGDAQLRCLACPGADGAGVCKGA